MKRRNAEQNIQSYAQPVIPEGYEAGHDENGRLVIRPIAERKPVVDEAIDAVQSAPEEQPVVVERVSRTQQLVDEREQLSNLLRGYEALRLRNESLGVPVLPSLTANIKNAEGRIIAVDNELAERRQMRENRDNSIERINAELQRIQDDQRQLEELRRMAEDMEVTGFFPPIDTQVVVSDDTRVAPRANSDMPMTAEHVAEVQRMLREKEQRAMNDTDSASIENQETSLYNQPVNRVYEDDETEQGRGISAADFIAAASHKSGLLGVSGASKAFRGATAKTREFYGNHPRLRRPTAVAGVALLASGLYFTADTFNMLPWSEKATADEKVVGENEYTIEQLGGCIDIETRDKAAGNGVVSGSVDVLLKQTDEGGKPFVFGTDGASPFLEFKGSAVYADVCATNSDALTVDGTSIVIDRSKVTPQILVDINKTTMQPIDAPIVDQLAVKDEVKDRLHHLLGKDVRPSYVRNAAHSIAESIAGNDSLDAGYDDILQKSQTVKKQLGNWAAAHNLEDVTVTFVGDYPAPQVVNKPSESHVSASIIDNTTKVTEVKVAAKKAEKKK